jgi:CubicO group peptidase (beta-lactamase class C family)
MPHPFIENANITGMSLSLCRNGLVKSVALGVVDALALEPEAAENTTLFQAASLSKVVSAAIVLDLFKENNWSLDTPLCELSAYGPPELQNHPYYKILTTRMILSQCSGLPNWFMGESKPSFIAQPNTQFTYSGLAFDFLKQIIENSMHKKWEDLAQNFFLKSNMNSSTFLQHAMHEGQKIARGHDGYGVPEQVVHPQDAPAIPAASLLTTSSDYIVFLRYCLSDPYLNTTLFATQTHLTASQFPKISGDIHKIKWGLGIGLFEDKGRTIAFHWGNHACSHAFAAIDLSNGDGVACFINSANGPNVFKHITQGVVGDMNPVFNWLENYCGFNAVVEPRDQRLGATLLRFAKNNLEGAQPEFVNKIDMKPALSRL